MVIIYLFSLYVLFSQYRSCDNTLENCFFQITPYPRAYLRIIYEETKGQVLLGPLMRKQNLQAKEDCWGEATETLVSRIQTHTHASGIRTPIPRCLLYLFLHLDLDSIAPYKGIQDSLRFWIPRHGFQIPGNGFQSLWVRSTLDKDSSVHLIYLDPSDLGSVILIWIMPKERTLCQWNLDSGFQSLVESGFRKLYSGFQSQGFRIPREKFSLFQNPDALRPRANSSLCDNNLKTTDISYP